MNNDTFLKACRREKTDFTPVWLMRQAGRYMKEYMEIRSKHSFLEMCKNPEIAAQITLQPVNKLGVDAAILFADILLPLDGMGIDFEFAKNEGPVIHTPVRTRKDIDKVRFTPAEEATPYVMEAIKIVKKELNGRVPLIGFSGAPFTLASYIIEAGGSKNYVHAKTLMYEDPEGWHILMNKIADTVISYLNAQIKAGAQAVQLFDSWVGCMCPKDYEEYVLPHSKKVIDHIDKSVPLIHFAFNASTLLPQVVRAGGDVIGLDWKIDLGEAWKTVGYDKAVQGNIDPVILHGPIPVIRKRVKEILDSAGGRPGHIFNLGHGILPTTPVEHAKALVDAVHEYSRR